MNDNYDDKQIAMIENNSEPQLLSMHDNYRWAVIFKHEEKN